MRAKGKMPSTVPLLSSSLRNEADACLPDMPSWTLPELQLPLTARGGGGGVGKPGQDAGPRRGRERKWENLGAGQYLCPSPCYPNVSACRRDSRRSRGAVDVLTWPGILCLIRCCYSWGFSRSPSAARGGGFCLLSPPVYRREHRGSSWTHAP